MPTCEVCGRSVTKLNSIYGQKVCNKHYQQILKYGRPLDNNPRTTKDMNEFAIDTDNGIAGIHLYNSKQEFMGEALIDLEDLDRVIVHKWRYWQGRVYTGNFKPIPLQYFVLNVDCCNLGKNIVIDHINNNPLDNRKCNLRITTQQVNTCNKSLPSNNSSNFVGVWFDKSRNKYSVEIKLNGKKCHLGRYDSIEDAVYARFVAEVLTFGNARSTSNDHNIKPVAKKCKYQREIYDYVCSRLDKKIGEYINI